MKDITQSKTYGKVLAHRFKCDKWTKEFCFDCFGGGLSEFFKNLSKENKRRMKK